MLEHLNHALPSNHQFIYLDRLVIKFGVGSMIKRGIIWVIRYLLIILSIYWVNYCDKMCLECLRLPSLKIQPLVII